MAPGSVPWEVHTQNAPEFRRVLLLVRTIVRDAKRSESLADLTEDGVRTRVEHSMDLPEGHLAPWVALIRPVIDSVLDGNEETPYIPPSRGRNIVACLPMEVMSRIFEFAVMEWEVRSLMAAHHAHLRLRRGSPPSSTSQLELVEFVRNMACVSRTWSRVVFGTPYMWHNVFGPNGPSYGMNWKKAVALSKAVPLYLWGDEWNRSLPALALLSTDGHRGRIAWAVISGRPAPVPQGSTWSTLPAQAVWSSLRVLSLTLIVGAARFARMLDALDVSSCLEELRIDHYDPMFDYMGHIVSRPPVVLSQLRRLIILYQRNRCVDAVFLAIRVPRLVEVTLRRTDEQESMELFKKVDASPDSVVGERLFSGVQTLCVGGTMSSRDIISTLIRTPSVMRMNITAVPGCECGVGEFSLSDVLNAVGYGGCLPRLKEVYLDIPTEEVRRNSVRLKELAHGDVGTRFGVRRIALSYSAAKSLLGEGMDEGVEDWESPEWDVLSPGILL